MARSCVKRPGVKKNIEIGGIILEAKDVVSASLKAYRKSTSDKISGSFENATNRFQSFVQKKYCSIARSVCFRSVPGEQRLNEGLRWLSEEHGKCRREFRTGESSTIPSYAPLMPETLFLVDMLSQGAEKGLVCDSREQGFFQSLFSSRSI